MRKQASKDSRMPSASSGGRAEPQSLVGPGADSIHPFDIKLINFHSSQAGAKKIFKFLLGAILTRFELELRGPRLGHSVLFDSYTHAVGDSLKLVEHHVPEERVVSLMGARLWSLALLPHQLHATNNFRTRTKLLLSSHWCIIICCTILLDS